MGTAAWAGVLAGLGLAMPLGAVATLLMMEGLVSGFRVAATGAAGIASVDTIYCGLAMSMGAVLAPAIAARRDAFLVVSGSVLIALGVRQMWGSRSAPGAAGSAQGGAGRSGRRCYLRFVALTAINPLTLVYFTALSGAVGGLGGSASSRVVFTLAVGVASLGWQLLLAGVGAALASDRLTARSRQLGSLAAGIVAVLGVAVVVSGLRGG